MRIVSIMNQKGGCGKTTTAINLAGIFARRGYRTLLVDMDPQSHCAAGLAIPEQRIDLDIGDAMLAEPQRGVEKTRLLWRASRNLDLAPSRMKLAGLEAARGGLADKPDAERRLASVLARLAPGYDVCFVDCSPSIGLLTFNALAAATHILVPVETSFFALQGATKQLNTMRTMAKRLGVGAEYWLVATLHDESSVLSRDLLEEMRRRFTSRVAPVVIRRDLSLKEAASFGQPVIEYAAVSAGASDYGALADWLASRLGLPQVMDRAAYTPGPVSAEPVEPQPVGNARDDAPPRVHVEAKPLAEVAVGAAPVSRETDASAEDEPPAPRAEDLAERARILLLKRADEQLRRVMGVAPQPTAEAAPPPEVVIARPSVVTAPSMAAQVAVSAAASPTSPTAREATVQAPTAAPASTRAEQLRNFFGARQTRAGVLFVQPLTLGAWVAIAGDFNDWTPQQSLMRRNEELGIFELCIPLSPGRRRYRLVVEGRWITDPANPRSEPNQFGEFNSIIDVAPAGAMST